jgi:APA family basic amino acid/polyamine antiporter
MFTINFGAAAISAGLITTGFFSWQFPAANQALAILIGAVLAIVSLFIVYSLFAASMPRSGGDYIYISRALNPALGFAGNFTVFYSNLIYLAASAVYTIYFITSAVASVGLLGNNNNLVQFGYELSTPGWIFGIGTIMIVALAAIAIWGSKRLVRVINVLFVVGVIGIFVLIGSFAYFYLSGGDFITIFNKFAGQFTNHTDTYHYIISSTQEAGFTVPAFSLNETLLAVPAHFSWIWAGIWSVYNAGEMKKGGDVRRQFVSMGGLLIFNAIIVAVIVLLLDTVVGHTFYAAMSYAFSVDPSLLPLPSSPEVNLFAGLMTHNAAVAIIVSIGVLAISLSLTAILYPMLTRVMLAYSFDRLLPAKFADVNAKFGTPHVAIIVATIIGVVALAVSSTFAPWLFINAALGTVYLQIAILFPLVGIAAIAFPYRHKKLFNISPAKKYSIGGVPLIVISGILTVLFFGWAGYNYVVDPRYGMTSTWWLPPYLLSIFFVPLIIFYVIRVIRMHQGIDINLLYQEIPPE